MDLDFSSFDPSTALAAIVSCTESEIVARTSCLPPYLALEAMAQACGMHLRHLHDFKVQAYLVSVSDLVDTPGREDMPLTIRASLTAETTAGASYLVTVDDGPACRILIGRQASDQTDTFFRSRFSCLRQAS
jgi:hypothetical protein